MSVVPCESTTVTTMSGYHSRMVDSHRTMTDVLSESCKLPINSGNSSPVWVELYSSLFLLVLGNILEQIERWLDSTHEITVQFIILHQLYTRNHMFFPIILSSSSNAIGDSRRTRFGSWNRISHAVDNKYAVCNKIIASSSESEVLIWQPELICCITKTIFWAEAKS